MLIIRTAEFRGPGVHHNFDDSDSGYDVDMDQKSKNYGSNQRGRIILLGDGTEVLTDSDDTEMFDNGEEDKDLASQVPKGQAAAKDASDDSTPAVIPDKLSVSDPKYASATDGALPTSSSKSEK